MASRIRPRNKRMIDKLYPKYPIRTPIYKIQLTIFTLVFDAVRIISKKTLLCCIHSPDGSYYIRTECCPPRHGLRLLWSTGVVSPARKSEDGWREKDISAGWKVNHDRVTRHVVIINPLFGFSLVVKPVYKSDVVPNVITIRSNNIIYVSEVQIPYMIHVSLLDLMEKSYIYIGALWDK